MPYLCRPSIRRCLKATGLLLVLCEGFTAGHAPGLAFLVAGGYTDGIITILDSRGYA